MKKILAIVQHRKGRSPGQRFRFEHYIQYLEKNGYEIIFSNIIDEKDDQLFYSHGKYFAKLKIVVKSFFHRLKDLKTARDCDLIFIYREAFMLGNTYFEKRFSKLDIPVVFDFDDSIWLNDTSDGNKNLAWIKKPEKTAKICKYADLVMVGNQYLADYAKQYNKNVVVVPTTIDINYHKIINVEKNNNKICIGWTGSTSTLKHFYSVIPFLKKLQKKYGDKIYFKVIANKYERSGELDVKFTLWNKENEIKELSEFDIGIMPLPDDKWSRGKCGFKGLQCMALKIPVVMSPVGVNKDIVQNGINGFLTETEDEWIEYLSLLIDSKEVRQKIGEEGYKTVKEKYSVDIWNIKILNIFDSLISEK
ncbi:MAG: glycosyltransferase [Bacteroidales bacterium]|nr:glycosyltransferase [Bacteroidales bacterium]